MNYAVLLYENVESNPEALPDKWPAEVLPLADGENPPTASWLVMTESELLAHKATHQASYNAWKAAKDASMAQENLIRGIKTGVLSSAQRFIDDIMGEMAAENIAGGITQLGKTGTVVGLMSLKVELPGNTYPISILDTLQSKSLTETLRLTDYFIQNIATYEVPGFFTAAKLGIFKSKIETFLVSGKW
jgi:hypothetical protein